MDEDKKDDLTSLENIGEFLHEEDDSLDTLLEDGTKSNSEATPPSKTSSQTLDEMVEETMSHQIESMPETDADSTSFEMPSEDSEDKEESIADFALESETENNIDSSISDGEPNLESSDLSTDSFDFQDQEISSESEEMPPPIPEEAMSGPSETVEIIEAIETVSFENPPLKTANKEKIQTELKKETIAIKDFADALQYGDINLIEGKGPNFTVLIKNIKYQEEADEIFEILSQHKLTSGKEEIIKNSLGRGRLQISQISEYSAIFLVHKFRHFDAEITMGLTHEMSPSMEGELLQNKGLTYKRTLYQNKSENIEFNQQEFPLESMIVTTTSQIDRYHIKQYLGIISEHTLINTADVEDEEHLEKLYKDLSERLRPKSLKLNGNAVVNVNYQLTPILSNDENEVNKYLYKVSCTGSAVYIAPQPDKG